MLVGLLRMDGTQLPRVQYKFVILLFRNKFSILPVLFTNF